MIAFAACETLISCIDSPLQAQIPDKVSLTAVPLDTLINSQFDERSLVTDLDGRAMVFLRTGEAKGVYTTVYTSRFLEGSWKEAIKLELPLPINAVGVFPGALTGKGTKLWIGWSELIGNKYHLHLGSLRRTDSGWRDLRLQYVDSLLSRTSSLEFTVSEDEKEMVVSLDRPNGIGKKDLYLSKALTDSTWSIPKLIDSINTPYNEAAPRFSEEQLYFSSDRPGGLGKYDLYKASDYHSFNSVVSNLSEPFNSKANDFYYSSPSFFISDRGGKGDIYTIQGNEKIEQKNPKAQESVSDTSLTRFIIYFDLSDSTILPEAERTLDSIAVLLKQDTSIVASLTGHTDNSGTQLFNLKLSFSRANTVASYLEQKGVASSQIRTGGVGSREPITDESTEEGQRQNRRVEILITGKRNVSLWTFPRSGKRK